MISQTITHYLADHKRLIVPQLGAFIVKVPGQEVIFSEMMKRDDGILRELLRREGMSEIEAAGAIDRFVFEIRHTVETDSVYRAEKLGVFAAGPNGTVRFRFLPEETPAERSQKAQPLSAQPETVPEPAETEAIGPTESGAAGPAANETGAPAAETTDDRPAGETAATGQPAAGVPAETTENPAEDPAEEARRKIQEIVKHEANHPSEWHSSSQPRRPDPSVRGLRYGQPQKNTNAYTYVNSTPSRRPDSFVILAAVVIVLALGALLYGFLNDRKARQQEQEYIESIAVDPETDA